MKARVRGERSKSRIIQRKGVLRRSQGNSPLGPSAGQVWFHLGG